MYLCAACNKQLISNPAHSGFSRPLCLTSPSLGSTSANSAPPQHCSSNPAPHQEVKQGAAAAVDTSTQHCPRPQAPHQSLSTSLPAHSQHPPPESLARLPRSTLQLTDHIRRLGTGGGGGGGYQPPAPPPPSPPAPPAPPSPPAGGGYAVAPHHNRPVVTQHRCNTDGVTTRGPSLCEDR
ncbi:hypothetical protein OSTOST_04373 [Ostertagia ostertagi]